MYFDDRQNRNAIIVVQPSLMSPNKAILMSGTIKKNT